MLFLKNRCRLRQVAKTVRGLAFPAVLTSIRTARSAQLEPAWARHCTRGLSAAPAPCAPGLRFRRGPAPPQGPDQGSESLWVPVAPEAPWL